MSESVGRSSRVEVDLDAFRAWLDQLPDDLDAAWKRTNDQVYCLLEQYDITGVGDDIRSSYYDAICLLSVYLISFFMEGKPVSAAARPIPTRLRLEIRRDVALGWLLRKLRVADVVVSEAKVFPEYDRIAAAAC